MLFKKLLGCCLVALATIAPYNTSNHKDSKPSFDVRNICRKAAVQQGIVNPANDLYTLKDLAAGRPAIIFGSLPKKNGESGLGNHAVVAYGVDKQWWGGYYIVNYGYERDTGEVDLGFGFVGSVCLFHLN